MRERQKMQQYPKYEDTEFIAFDTPIGTVSITFESACSYADEELVIHVSCERKDLSKVVVLDDWGAIHSLEA